MEQEWSILYPKFVIKDDRGDPVMRIDGPFCGCECCSDVDFTVTSATDGSEVGSINNNPVEKNSPEVCCRLVKYLSNGQV